VVGDITNNAALVVNRSDTVTLPGVISGSGSLSQIGTGTTILTADNTYTGGTTIAAGTLQLGNGGTTGSVVGDITNNAALVVNRSDTVTLPGVISGSGSLSQIGTGTTILTADNTYTGGTTIAAGTLQLGNGGTAGSIVGNVTNNGVFAIDRSDALTFAGTISGTGAFAQNGSGVTTLSGASSYAGATTVNGGTLSVTGDISTSSGVAVNSGATLNGTGTVSSVTVNNGGTLAPGVPPAIGMLTINGSLTLASAAAYLVQISATGASKANISGSASLGGTIVVDIQGFTPGLKYTLLTAAGGIGATRFANEVITDPSVKAVVSYDANDVFLTIMQESLAALVPTNLSGNQTNVANAIDAFVNAGGTLPPGFADLFALSPDQLREGLAQRAGENSAGGIRTASFQLMNEFLLLMLNRFDTDRCGSEVLEARGMDLCADVNRFAPEREPPPEIAQAYAAVTPASERTVPLASRWHAWASAFGGANNTNGDPNGSGAHNVAARTGAVAAGLDYKVSPDTLIGFALAGGGTSWGLSQGLGGGRSDAFQAGLYGSQKFGSWYLSGAFAYTDYMVSTSRMVTIAALDTLNAGFNAQSWGGRVEAGYRIAWALVNLTPYAALQAQSFATPNYSETATSGSNQLALSFASHTSSVVRSELGSWLSNNWLLADHAVMTVFGRIAWAHDWQDAPQSNAVFLGLSPVASFIVNGAKPAADLGVVTAGAEIRMASGWALMGKFDGEFGSGTQTYVGTARVRYAW
jgi:outer membrane autotransporter protein